MKYLRAASAGVTYLLLLLGFYYAHVKLLRVDVVLYSALTDAVAAAAVVAALLLTAKVFSIFNLFEKMLLTVICLLSGYVFAISIPTLIDRSLSFYILEKMQQRGGGIKQDRFAEVFTREYLIEHRLVDVRLTEQLESGTILIENGCVKLTERMPLTAMSYVRSVVSQRFHTRACGSRVWSYATRYGVGL